MNRQQVFDGFQFDNDAPVDDKIGAKGLVEQCAFVLNRNGFLSFHGEATSLEGLGQDHFIDRFQQAGTKVTVNSNTRIDDRARYVVEGMWLEWHHPTTTERAVGMFHAPASRGNAEVADRGLLTDIGTLRNGYS